MYLVSIHRHSKWLFAVVAAGILMQLAATYTGMELTPFLNYGMYTHAAKSTAKQKILVVEIDGERFDLYSVQDVTRQVMLSNLRWYAHVKSAGDPNQAVIDRLLKTESNLRKALRTNLVNNEDHIDAFPAWFVSYISRFTNTTNGVAVYVVNLRFENETVQEIDKRLLLKTRPL
jgi:hypothetical protein